MKAKPTISFRNADTDYQIGQTYDVTKELVHKYPDRFDVIEEPVAPKVEPKQTAKNTETKRVAKTEDKSG